MATRVPVVECQNLEGFFMSFSKKRRAELDAIGYGSWLDMRARCLRPSCKAWRHYGARGISVCAQWSTFAAFLKDMGPRPKGYSLERKDVNGNYEPSNCEWIPLADQSKNTRRTIWFIVNGEKMCMKDACKKLGVSYTMVRLRIWALGWEPESALYTPSKTKQNS